MRNPECCRDCKHRRSRGTAVIQRSYLSSEVNNLIAIAAIDRTAPRQSTTKCMFSQNPKLIGSVTSDGLIDIYKRRVSLNIIQKSANRFGRKIGFKIENESEDQHQSSPKLIGILRVLRCIFGPNLVILTWTAYELWCCKAQNEVKFNFQVKFDLEVQGQSSPKTIGTSTKVFCICGPNLVILAWMSDELSCGQAHDWHTHWHTDPQMQPMTIPEGQNWPRVKTIIYPNLSDARDIMMTFKCWAVSKIFMFLYLHHNHTRKTRACPTVPVKLPPQPELDP